MDLPLQHGTPSIAFTYNEPTIWAEYVIDIAKAAHQAGLYTVMVSNGYITREAFFDVYQHIDAANIDLKGFTENFYSKITLSHLPPVLDVLRWLRRETNVWFEITNLMIPGLNDATAKTANSATGCCRAGRRRPAALHRLPPGFQNARPPATPSSTLDRARQIASESGSSTPTKATSSDGGNTICPGCHRAIIRRSWHAILSNDVGDGRCKHCGTKIPGVFSKPEAERRRGAGHLHPASAQ